MRGAKYNHAITLERLTEAEKHVEIGDTLLAETRARIEAKMKKGLDVGEAEATLTLLEETQALRVADRDRIRRELDELH